MFSHRLNMESGVHRVQRVPQTETQGGSSLCLYSMHLPMVEEVR